MQLRPMGALVEPGLCTQDCRPGLRWAAPAELSEVRGNGCFQKQIPRAPRRFAAPTARNDRDMNPTSEALVATRTVFSQAVIHRHRQQSRLQANHGRLSDQRVIARTSSCTSFGSWACGRLAPHWI